MKTDSYTKTILTVIALLLAFVVLKPLVMPEMSSHAQQAAQKIPPAQKKSGWDYKVVNVDYINGLDSMKQWYEDGEKLPGPVNPLGKVQQLGAQGWELIEWHIGGNSFFIVFKKPA